MAIGRKALVLMIPTFSLLGSGEATMLDWPLTPPTQLTLIISLLLAIFACLVHWLHLAVPPLQTGFVALLLAYLALLAGNVFRGLKGLVP
jgi:hypothetical protein